MSIYDELLKKDVSDLAKAGLYSQILAANLNRQDVLQTVIAGRNALQLFDVHLPDPLDKKAVSEEFGQAFKQVAQILQKIDFADLELVDLNNPNRLLRALEVCIQTGKTYTSLRRNTKKARPFRIIKIGLNMERDLLFKRIGERVDRMMKNALLEEVKSLLPYREHNALNTVGYKELFRYLDGEVSLEQAVENIKTNSRRYAKRQLTWLKRDPEMLWFSPDEYNACLKKVLGEI